MNSQLERIIKLIKKTGDRMVVYDSQKPDDTYVVMSIDEYEKIVDDENLTEEEMTDKINRDIATWRNEQFSLDFEGQNEQQERPQSLSSHYSSEASVEEKRGGNPWKISKNVKKGAVNSKTIRIDDEEERNKYPGIKF